MRIGQQKNSGLPGARFVAGVAIAATLLACGGDGEKSYQRKVVRVEPTSTPLVLRGRPTPRRTYSTPKPSPSPPPKVFTAAVSSPTPSPTPSPRRGAVASAGSRALLVTTHTLATLRADEKEFHRIEGKGLAGCRVFLRRYGAETELIPTRKSETLIEFRNLPLVFLERGTTYDLVVRDAMGREWLFPEAVTVATRH